MTESISKSKSVLMITLLLLAPTLVLITSQVAYAASPTIALSTSSGTGNSVTTGVKITGTGFPALANGTGAAMYFISTSKTLSVAGATQVNLYGQSIRVEYHDTAPKVRDCGSSTSGGCPPAKTVSVDGSGNFIAFFNVPSLPADTYNVFVTYTPSGGSQTNSSPVTFTVAPYLDVRLATDDGLDASVPTSRSAHFGQWVRVRVYGFGASETVTVTGFPALGTVSLGTGSTGAYTTQVFAHLTAETTGGSKTFTAVGGTSGVTATRSFTINPSIAIYSSQQGLTQISIPAGAPNTAYIELHGFANGESISAATVGGNTASFGGATTNADGSFGVGGGAHLSLLYTTSLSYGSTSITLTGSKTGTVTFNAVNGNVINPYAATGTTSVAVAGTLNLLNTPILASTVQASGTSIIAFDSASGFAASTPTLYLTGWGNGVSFVISPQGSSGLKFDTTRVVIDAGVGSTTVAFMDGNGAAVLKATMPSAFRGAHTITLTTSAGSSATNPGTTWTMKPQLYFYTYNAADDAAGYAAFTNAGTASTYGYVAVSGSGFGADTSTAESLSLTIGTYVVSATFISSGSISSGDFSLTALSKLPDLAAGSYKVTASGATTGDNATGYDNYNYVSVGAVVTDLVVVPNFYLSSSLSVSAVSKGTAVVIQTTTSAGIHGLKPSASYEVHLDGPSGTLLTTLTSTSGGAVPAGSQFVVPATSAGVHIIDFVQSGASVVIGQTVNVLAVGSTTTDESSYGKLFINLTGTIAVTPSAGTVASTVSLSGTGLAASTKYNVQLAVNGIAYASFTTTSDGALPSGISFIFPAIGSTTETGTSETIQLLNTATNVVDSTGTFLLQAGMSIAPTTAAPGTSVKATGTGLVASTGYNIVWNAGLNSNGKTTGTIIGAFTTGSDGSASANFTVPASAAAGSYAVSLLRTTDVLGSDNFRLVTSATETVSIGGANLQGTSTFAASGAATQINLNGAPALQISYTNNVASAVTGIVYAVVHNAAGQTVYYTTATVTPGAGATATAYLILAGLPSGTYSVTIFAVTPSGVAISATSTATATL